MDCSLSTWPSITQFDDFSWAGLGDIDPLESLDRSFDNEPGSSLSNLQETTDSTPASTSAHISHAQNDDLYRLTSSDSIVDERWENINGVDLASVLDSTFPSNGDPSTPSAEDVYHLYSGSILNDVDTFMSDSMSEIAEGNTTFRPLDNAPMEATLVTPDLASLTCSLDDVKCESGDTDGSPGSINIPQVGTSKPVVIRGDCNVHNLDIFENRGGVRVNMVQPFPFNPMKPPVSGDSCASTQCAMDLKESIFPQRPDCIQTGLMMPWSKAQSTSTNPQGLDREKVVHSSSVHFGDNYPAIIDQQVRMADAARVELKRNRAQASRARRLAANQRRAKKYPLQKLIRMSTSPTSTRDRLEQNVAGSVAMLHHPVHMVSPNQYPGGVQALPKSSLNTQIASCLPVLQSSHVISSHKVLSQSNPVRGGPYYCYQQTSMTPIEDNRVSSGSCEMQFMCTDQDVQSKSSTPTAAFSNSASSTQSLDAALLEQLQTILSKMNVNVRLCIRDALYRLANSAKHRQSRNDTSSDSSSSHSKEAMETNTNSIDRWIVNILFCKQPASFELNSQSYPPNLTHAPNQFIQNFNINSSSQQWNSCGSSINLQEQPLHVVTGL